MAASTNLLFMILVSIPGFPMARRVGCGGRGAGAGTKRRETDFSPCKFLFLARQATSYLVVLLCYCTGPKGVSAHTKYMGGHGRPVENLGEKEKNKEKKKKAGNPSSMARGQQLIQSQQRAAKKREKERKAKANKGGGTKGPDLSKAAKCKICMTVIPQINKLKPKTLKALERHMNRHPTRAFGDAFPDYTPEAIAAESQGESKTCVFVTEYDAEQAVKAFPREERQAAIAKVTKEVWRTMGWKARLEVLEPTEKQYKADKPLATKKKSSHKRH